MPQYVANDARHQLARCERATEGGVRPVRVDLDAENLHAAQHVLPRCPDCWREYEERQGAAATAADRRELQRRQAAATPADRRRVADILDRTRRKRARRPGPVREPDASVLARLDRPRLARELADELGLTVAAVTASLARLQAKGKVEIFSGPAPAAAGEPTGSRYVKR